MRIPLWQGVAPYSDASKSQPQPYLEEYRADTGSGAIVVCPGGGYRIKAEHEGKPIAEMLRDAGISAYVLDYRVGPCDCFAPLSDATRAIRVVRSMGFPKVGILGFSAGGHLACNAATHFDAGDPDAADPVERHSSRPDALGSCYSVVSMTAYQNVESCENLLADKQADTSLKQFFSAEQNVTTDTPPTFIWHTADDKTMPVQNSILLAKALADHGVPFALHIFPEGAHGLGLARNDPVVSRWSALFTDWLLRAGF